MLNSVAKYLWGSSTEHEQEYTDKGTLEQQHGTGEHLETQQEEDWVVVGGVADKENNEQLSSHHHPPHHSLHLYHHQNHCQNQTESELPQSSTANDSISQYSPTASDAELLDDAATLAESLTSFERGYFHHHIPYNPRPDSPYPLQDYNTNTEDSYSDSDSDSMPESVFSVCSGRSHATYHPRGMWSEPWVVAPSPCFIGINLRFASAPSNPLENLLIEHPSMSVYLSIPPSSPPPLSPPAFHPFQSTYPTGDIPIGEPRVAPDEGDVAAEEQANDDQISGELDLTRDTLAVQSENRFAHPALPSPQLLIARVHASQRVQRWNSQKQISNRKCEHQNKVQGYPCGSNRWNKRIRPSGFKASRCSQRM